MVAQMAQMAQMAQTAQIAQMEWATKITHITHHIKGILILIMDKNFQVLVEAMIGKIIITHSQIKLKKLPQPLISPN